MTSCYFENSADHSYAYSYDNYGNRVEKKAYSGNAVLAKYTWTRGRLLERIANASNATIGQYTYDLNGVRYTKTAGGVTTTYFYNGNTLLGENKSDGKRLRYFYDATGLCGFSYFNGSETQYYTYVKDVLGNIVMIKDHLGLLMTKYTYDEWGNCTVNNLVGTIGNVNPFRYRGYYFDTESGLYYLMSRYYDPEIGQFISMDTPDYLYPETIGGVDLYAYGLNNPVMYYDPTGHEVEWGKIGTIAFTAIVGLGLFAFTAVTLGLPMAIGITVIGFGLGIAGSAISQYGKESFNWGEAVYNGAWTAISLLAASTGVTWLQSAGLGFVMGAIQSIGYDNLFRDGNIDVCKMLISAGAGALSGLFAGKGAQNDIKAMQNAWVNMLDAFKNNISASMDWSIIVFGKKALTVLIDFALYLYGFFIGLAAQAGV